MTASLRIAFVLVLALPCLALPSLARAEPGLGDIECDPFPFATGRYGCQIGARPPVLHGVRISVAQFSIDVPDTLTELLGNDGFHVDVRPGSGALYVLYYLGAPGADGLAIGGS